MKLRAYSTYYDVRKCRTSNKNPDSTRPNGELNIEQLVERYIMCRYSRNKYDYTTEIIWAQEHVALCLPQNDSQSTRKECARIYTADWYLFEGQE